MTTVVTTLAEAKKIKFGEPYILMPKSLEKALQSEVPDIPESVFVTLGKMESVIAENTSNPPKKEVEKFKKDMKQAEQSLVDVIKDR